MALTFAWIAVALSLVTSVGSLLARDWRLRIIFLAAQYLAMFILVLRHLPLGMASVKVITGWMSAVILGMTVSGLPRPESSDEEGIWPRGRLFRLFAAGIVCLMVLAATPRVDSAMADAGFAVTSASLLLIGMGLLHLGITSQALRLTIGLMTVLSGFEILYSAVESSTLVTLLLAIINLGLALAGSYVIVASSSGEAESA